MTVMEKCEAAVVETGMRLVPGLIMETEEPETEHEEKTEEVGDEDEAYEALSAEGGLWEAWGHVVEAAEAGGQSERVPVAGACPALVSEVREASEGAEPLQTECERAGLPEVSAEEAWRLGGWTETPGRGVPVPLTLEVWVLWLWKKRQLVAELLSGTG